MKKATRQIKDAKEMAIYYTECSNNARNFANEQDLRLKELLCTASLALVTIFTAIIDESFILELPLLMKSIIFGGIFAFAISIVFGCLSIIDAIKFLHRISEIHGELSNSIRTYNNLDQANTRISELKERENQRSKKWPLVVQLISFFLGLAIVMVYLFLLFFSDHHKSTML